MSLPARSLKLIKKGSGLQAYHKLRQALYDFYTTVGELDDTARDILVVEVTELYGELLKSIRITPSVQKSQMDIFGRDFITAIDTTRYLCWVRAKPGEVVDLQVTYTTTDKKHILERRGLRQSFRRFREGNTEPRYRRRKIWADWYRQFGIAPLNYEFSVPSQQHARSYYFTIEPPKGTRVTYLDWETGNSFRNEETREIDCAFPSAHIHSEEVASLGSDFRGGTVRAYLRCAPHHHKQILGTTILNGILVYAIVANRLPVRLGEPIQSIILTIPSVLTAYIVQQQQHYHAHAIRKQRIILWSYLAISVTFLLTISFSRSSGDLGSRGLGAFATVVTWTLAASSAAIFAWYILQGHSFTGATEFFVRRRKKWVSRQLDRERLALEEIEQADSQKTLPKLDWYARRKKSIARREESLEPWRCYERGLHQFSGAVFRSALFVAASVLCVLALVWRFPPRHKPPVPATKTTKVSVSGDLMMDAIPKGCNNCQINVRLSPSAVAK